jgi:D-alanyl-D-alanine carboxypeptidase
VIRRSGPCPSGAPGVPVRRAVALGALLACLGALAACTDDSDPGAVGMSSSTTTAAAEAESVSPATAAALDAALSDGMAASGANGVIAGVWIGERAWTAASGAPDTQEHHRIGSVTKTLTGTLVLQLVEEGEVSLDDTVDRWFPDVEGADAITLRMLGEMSSGIASYTADEATVDAYLADPTREWRPDELVAVGTGLPRAFPPGEGFLYSNTNTVMLGLIVEQVSGRPLADVMAERLFEPLGMGESSYPDTDRLPEPFWRGSTLQGSTDDKPRDATEWSPTFAGPAGQVVSTLEDMRRWTVALGTGALLEPSTQEQRLRTNVASQRDGRAYGFAVGIQGPWLLHSGELPGYNTQVAYDTERDIAVVVFVNSDIPGPDGANPAPVVFASLVSALEGVPG